MNATKSSLPYEQIWIDSSLHLKQLDPSDAAHMFSLVNKNRTYLGKWLSWVDETKSIQDMDEFIASMIEKRISGSEYGYGIVVDGVLVGHISLMHISDENEPEIGYWIAKSASGKGITTKAAKVLTDFGFSTLKLAKIIIKADPDNLPNNKVAEKLGYELERIEGDPRIENPANVWSKATTS